MPPAVVEEAKLAVSRSTYWYPRFRTTFGRNIYSIPPPATQPVLIDDVCELSDRPPVLKLLFKSTLPYQSTLALVLAVSFTHGAVSPPLIELLRPVPDRSVSSP